MSKTVAQIFATNPTTVVADTDLYYLVQSPYIPGSDAAISGASLKSAFGTGGTINPGLINQLGYYAAAGSTISGLATLASGTLITSAGGVPSISQTLPSVVQGNITTLGTITTGVWNGTLISPTFGGTGINNGARTITLGGSLTTSGAFASTFTMTNTTNVTFPVSGTLATTSQLLTSPLTTKGDIWVWSTTNDRLPVATGDGKILQVSSGAAIGLAYSTATYPSTVSASGILWASSSNVIGQITNQVGGVLISNNAGTPNFLSNPGTTGNLLQSNANNNSTWTTSTYPATNAINTLLYASAANVMSALATANSSVLVTSAGGVPSLSTTLPSGISATGMLLTTPNITTGLLDTNGNIMISFSAQTSAVNFFTITNAATTGQLDLFAFGSDTNVPMGIITKGNGNINFYANGGVNQTFVLFGSTTSVNFISITPANTTASPILAALGSDTNIALTLNGKGNSGVAIQGTTAAGNASSGYVGEFLSSSIASASAVAVTRAVATDITSISLTAGDWDVWGNGLMVTVGTTTSAISVWCSITSATQPDASLRAQITLATGTLGANTGLATNILRVNVSGSQTVYLSCLLTDASGNGTACGSLYARRRR